MDKLFVDTDIFLDLLEKREPFFEDARTLFLMAEEDKIELFTSAVSIVNIAYLLRKKHDTKQVRTIIKKILTFTEIAETNKQVIYTAADSDFTDFEDAVQHFTARTIKSADALITRNIKDYKHSEISVYTPAEYLKKL